MFTLKYQFVVKFSLIALYSSGRIFSFHRILPSFRRSVRLFSSSSVFTMSDSSKPIVIGLTGSIGMGKSTVTKQFRRLGFPVFDADEAVHALYAAHGAAVEPIKQLYPTAINQDNAVDRKALMSLIMQDGSVLKQIEGIVHPLVIARRQAFFDTACQTRQLLVVYDIPLLFEQRQAYRDIDYTILVSCDATTQRQRVLSRPGMTDDKFVAILSKQMSDADKRQRADFIIETGYPTFSEARHQLAVILEEIVTKREEGRYSVWRLGRPSYLGRQQTDREVTPNTQQTDGQAVTTTRQTADEVKTPQTAGQTAVVSSSSSSLVKGFVFDLDETLAVTALPNLSGGPLVVATAALQTYMQDEMPLYYSHLFANNHNNNVSSSSSSSSSKLIRAYFNRAIAQYPLIAHDLSEVRVRSLQLLCDDLLDLYLKNNHNNPDDTEDYTQRLQVERSKINEAIQVLVRARSQIDDYYYSDALPALSYLLEGSDYKVGILTNGNCDASYSASLSSMQPLLLYFNAIEVGAMKPSPIGFLAIYQHWRSTGCIDSIEQLVYIGDDYRKDIQGAKAVGMTTAWLLREDHPLRRGEGNEADGSQLTEEQWKSRYPDADYVLFDLRIESLQKILKQGNNNGKQLLQQSRQADDADSKELQQEQKRDEKSMDEKAYKK